MARDPDFLEVTCAACRQGRHDECIGHFLYGAGPDLGVKRCACTAPPPGRDDPSGAEVEVLMAGKVFAYLCPNCGEIVSDIAQDTIGCRCGSTAKRKFAVSVNRTSLKSEGRWDPTVGAYVENDRQFQSLLAQGVDRESESLGMDVKIAQIDPRDVDARSELHGIPKEVIEADTEITKRAKHDAVVH